MKVTYPGLGRYQGPEWNFTSSGQSFGRGRRSEGTFITP
jgi:hypothetical protein